MANAPFPVHQMLTSGEGQLNCVNCIQQEQQNSDNDYHHFLSEPVVDKTIDTEMSSSSNYTKHGPPSKSVQGSFRKIVSDSQLGKNLEQSEETSIYACSKARIRSIYCDIFIAAISKFVSPTQIAVNVNNSDRFIICARVRPLLNEEIIHKDIYDCITSTNDIVTVHAGNLHLNKLELKSTNFQLNHIFGQQSNNQDVYNVVRRIIIQSIPQVNALPIDSTLFLYGKTGTGKSYTISGIAQLFAKDVFDLVEKSQCQIRIGISAVEIVAGTKGFIVSRDNVCDLYNNGAFVHFRDDTDGNLHLRGAKELLCNDSISLDAYIREAKLLRKTQATARNPESSRSHLIYFIRLRTAADNLEDGKILSTITFVDLAGNEGQQDSLHFKGNSNEIKNSTSINRSLASLKNCIRASTVGSKVIPFRGSTLTRLLKKCFYAKDSKTIFIGNVSGLPMDAEQSISTLKYMGLVKWTEQDFIMEQKLKLNIVL